MIDNKIILFGGGAVLVVLLLAGGRRSGASSPAVAAIEAQATRDAIAPSVVGAVSTFQLQHEQNLLQANASNNQTLAGVITALDQGHTSRYGQTLNFTGNVINAGYADKSDVRHVEMARTLGLKSLSNDALAIQGSIDIQKKQQDNNFFTDLFGGAVRSGSQGLVTQGLGSLSGLLGNMGGGNSLLSNTGGGVGGSSLMGGANMGSMAGFITPALAMVA